jgi:hypothetical protein
MLLHRQLFRTAALAWFLLLIVGSLQPARPSLVRSAHREIHYLAFAGGALLLFCLSQSRRQESLAAAATLMLGVSIETLQHIIYHNPMEWWDIRDDGLAILAALVLYRFAGAWKPAPALTQ